MTRLSPPSFRPLRLPAVRPTEVFREAGTSRTAHRINQGSMPDSARLPATINSISSRPRSLFAALGFAGVGAHAVWPDAVPYAVGVHVWAIGAVGTMTLAMMTRATLGHEHAAHLLHARERNGQGVRPLGLRRDALRALAQGFSPAS